MSQAPSMPMFWDAYIGDTTHLTTEEHGAYLLLLAAMWRRNAYVPNDDRDIARIVGLPRARWTKTKARLSPLLIITESEITQKNLLKIWKITQEKIEKNRANGGLGGRPKINNNNGLDKANGYVSHNPNDNPNETIPEPETYTEDATPNGVALSSQPLSSISLLETEKKEGSAREIDAEFEKVWTHYPRKVGKDAARKAWAKARRKSDKDTIGQSLWAHIKVWNNGTAKGFIPHLATWLNEGRWKDEAEHAANRRETSDEQLNGLMTQDPLASLKDHYSTPKEIQ